MFAEDQLLQLKPNVRCFLTDRVPFFYFLTHAHSHITTSNGNVPQSSLSSKWCWHEINIAAQVDVCREQVDARRS